MSRSRAKEIKNLFEGDIKTTVINKLFASGFLSGDTALINEFTVDGWSRRADLVVANGKLHAFEIKSASDSLVRLRGQLETYQLFFDKVTLVIADRHEEKALSITPDSVEVWRVHDDGKLTVLRRGRSKDIRDRNALISLLRVRDLRSLLRNSGISPLPKLRDDLVPLAHSLSVAQLRKRVLASIKNRYAKTTQAFIRNVGKGPVRPMNLEKLSLYLADRRALEEQAQQLEKKKKAWLETLPPIPDDNHLARWADSMPPEPFGPIPDHIRSKVS